jgi:hypothetical protein
MPRNARLLRLYLHTSAHEAAHVIQQRNGVQRKDGVGRDGDKYDTNGMPMQWPMPWFEEEVSGVC